jgi:DHA1 family bicyclomycin/chloramphenicol resistance-like MFS transporter
MWVVAATVGSAIMGITLLTPALPLLQQQFAAGSDAVQLQLTVYLFALAAGQLVCGTWSDSIGRRPLLLWGTFLFTLGGALGLTAGSIEWLTAFRIIQGLGASACLSMGRAMVNDCFTRAEAARHMATIQIMVAIAPILSLALGGVLAEIAGWRGALLVMTTAGATVMLLSIFKTTETHIQRTAIGGVTEVFKVYKNLFANPAFLSFTVTGSLQVAMFFSMSGFMPFQYQRNGFSPMEFGFWFSLTSVFYLIGNTTNRLYFVSRGLERAAMIGCSLCLLSVTAMFATQELGMTHPLSLVIPCCLFGFSNGIILGNSMVGAMSAAGQYAGSGAGLAGAAQMAAGALFGSSIVAIGGADDFTIASLSMVAMSLVSLCSIYYVYKHRFTINDKP